MTPTTRLPLVERLRLLASPAAENWPDYVRINSMVADGLEAAALIEKQGAVIAALIEALKKADQFMTNGIELGYIRLPTDPDSALLTPGVVRAALLAAKTLGERE